jgi:hypothetical protein
VQFAELIGTGEGIEPPLALFETRSRHIFQYAFLKFDGLSAYHLSKAYKGKAEEVLVEIQ